MNQANTFITIVNATVADLYLQALSGSRKEIFSRNRMVMDVNEMLKDCITIPNKEMKIRNSKESEEWFKRNGYCYEQVIKTDQIPKKFPNMLRDLDGFFGRLYGITGRVEKRKTRCLSLIRTSKDVVLPADGFPDCIEGTDYFKLTNLPLSRFINSLNKKYMSCSQLPLVDGTNYKENVNLEIRACLKDIRDINAALEKYHLRFIDTVKELDMVVIKEKNKRNRHAGIMPAAC